MAVRIKIDPVERVTQASIRADLSLLDRTKAAADFAREGIAQADQANRRVLGRVPPKTITVDGRKGAALETVNPDAGNIIVEYELIVDVLRWIGKTLVERSPQVSGAYKRGHTLFAGGQEVTLGGQIPQSDDYVFTNLVPYARKIEVGKTESGRAFVIQVPNRIYERTAKDAKSRFGNIADIQFGHRQMTRAYTLRQSHGRRRGRQAGDAISAPAITVTYRR